MKLDNGLNQNTKSNQIKSKQEISVAHVGCLQNNILIVNKYCTRSLHTCVVGELVQEPTLGLTLNQPRAPFVLQQWSTYSKPLFAFAVQLYRNLYRKTPKEELYSGKNKARESRYWLLQRSTGSRPNTKIKLCKAGLYSNGRLNNSKLLFFSSNLKFDI